MEMMRLHELRFEQTVEHLLKCIDKTLDEEYMNGDDIRKVKDAWKAIYYAKMSLK